MRAGLTF